MPQGDYSLLLLIVALVAMMWWMSRRTRKQQRQAALFRENLAVGQEVMTGSGLFGIVTAVEDDRITLTSAGSSSVWLRQAIAKVIEPDDAVEPAGSDAGTASAETDQSNS